MGITVSGGDDPTGIPGTVEPESPPVTVTVSVPGTPSPAVTETVTETASARPTPSVPAIRVTETLTPSAAPQTTPSPTVKPKVIYRTKTAQPSTAPNPIPAATLPDLSSTVRPEGEISFPSVASPAQSQPGITINLPPVQPVAADSPGAMTWVLVALLVCGVVAVMSVGLWAFIRKVKREG